MTTTNTKAAQFINFFPGNTQDERSITIDAQAGYAIEDLEGFVKSVIAGCTSSCYIAADGEDGDLASLIAALEDGALLAEWFGGGESEDETEEQRAQREAVEEVHATLVESKLGQAKITQRTLAELKNHSTDSIQMYGPSVDEDGYGCQDYTKAIKLQGVRLVDEKWLQMVLSQRDSLLKEVELLKATQPTTTLTIFYRMKNGTLATRHIDYPATSTWDECRDAALDDILNQPAAEVAELIRFVPGRPRLCWAWEVN